jgi:hypothetical protein
VFGGCGYLRAGVDTCERKIVFIRYRLCTPTLHIQLPHSLFMTTLNNADLQLLSMWNNPELNDALKKIQDCQHLLGQRMTNEERNRLEKITAIFPEAPPRSPTRRVVREHYTKREVWERLWVFLLQYPVLKGSTIEEIIEKLEYLQRNS